MGKSYGGPNSAGTICFQSNWYEGPKFPRDVLRDCQSVRGRTLMHNKVTPFLCNFLSLDFGGNANCCLVVIIRPTRSTITLSDTNKRCPAWAYVGSANLSESAWYSSLGPLIILNTNWIQGPPRTRPHHQIPQTQLSELGVWGHCSCIA